MEQTTTTSDPMHIQRKHARAARESYGYLLAVGGILVLLNVLSVFFFVRLDLTHKRLFSLSDGSKKLAGRLSDQMEITAYFTDNLPPPFNATERYVRDLLEEYESASRGKIRVRHVNPDTDEKMQAAEQDGIRKVSHQVVENDGVNMREGYRGLVFKYLGETKTIPVVEDTAGLEYAISQNLKQMIGDKIAIGIVTGHEGPTLARGLSGLRQAAPVYEIREVDVHQPVSKDLKALLLVSPETALQEEELRNLDAYVLAGGSLGVFGGSLKVSLDGMDPKATPVDTGVNKLLAGWDLKLEKELVADAQCGRAPMQTMFGMAVLVPYPLVPIVTFDEYQSSHPALFRLDQAVTPFTAPISILKKGKPEGYKRTILAKSSKQSWAIASDSISLQPKAPKDWDQNGRGGPFALGVALQGKIPSGLSPSRTTTAPAAGKADQTADAGAPGDHARVLVFGTSGFMRDEFLPRADEGGQRDAGGALAFALNAIDWLAQDSDLVAIRAKNVEDPALQVPVSVQQAEKDMQAAVQDQDKAKLEKAAEQRKQATQVWDAKKTMYRWANTLGIPLLFALFGVIRWRARKRGAPAVAALA
jgi:ABC-2 type transport system permease protein